MNKPRPTKFFRLVPPTPRPESNDTFRFSLGWGPVYGEYDYDQEIERQRWCLWLARFNRRTLWLFRGRWHSEPRWENRA